MNDQLYIITGASRGMGLAIAAQLLKPGNSLLCISRQINPGLADSARAAQVSLEQWPLNLDHTIEAAAMLSQWLASRKPGAFQSATLINNAALLPRIVPLSEANPTELAQAMRVGLEAPLQLTAAFLKSTENWQLATAQPITRKVLNISSGNGRRPMASQAIYSATKAGMDHFTRCLALEEARKPNGAKVCSLAPGVIDTDMQTHLRNSNAASFPDHSRFVDMKTQAQLSTPADAARSLLAYLGHPNFGNNPVADIRDAL